MNYLPDKGGQFASDVHRRVLGHLSTPDEPYGWTPQALFARLSSHEQTVSDLDELGAVLGDLEADGLARSYKDDAWRQTSQGFELLTGPIADEPLPGAAVQGPAVIGAQKPQPTPIGGKD